MTFLDFLAWVPMVLSTLISGVMLEEICVGPRQRTQARVALAAIVAALRHRDPSPLHLESLRLWIRFNLRVISLLLIFASGGVAATLPLAGGLHASPIEVAFRWSLTIFLALHAPCPLWKYLFSNHRNMRGGHVH